MATLTFSFRDCGKIIAENGTLLAVTCTRTGRLIFPSFFLVLTDLVFVGQYPRQLVEVANIKVGLLWSGTLPFVRLLASYVPPASFEVEIA
jgi:hypothetical protein